MTYIIGNPRRIFTVRLRSIASMKPPDYVEDPCEFKLERVAPAGSDERGLRGSRCRRDARVVLRGRVRAAVFAAPQLGVFKVLRSGDRETSSAQKGLRANDRRGL